MASQFVGKYKMISSTNFDEYMKQLGVDFATRKIANALSPSIEISIDGDHWTVKTSSTFKSEEAKFVLGKQVEMTTLDGRRVNVRLFRSASSLFWQKCKFKLFFLQICRCDNVECKRVYKRE
ncbi:Fatty acid binding protein [Trichuris trichiura]|uniref:Fatty acid binding protein n=1 Tax=Trichuris trichiura TaxID=36087 RepID=A0A077ZB79_TRITR|nr:Fatty acid binding protein [Trichuris trichiura]